MIEVKTALSLNTMMHNSPAYSRKKKLLSPGSHSSQLRIHKKECRSNINGNDKQKAPKKHKPQNSHYSLFQCYIRYKTEHNWPEKSSMKSTLPGIHPHMQGKANDRSLS